jgi:hypothetical protein
LHGKPQQKQQNGSTPVETRPFNACAKRGDGLSAAPEDADECADGVKRAPSLDRLEDESDEVMMYGDWLAPKFDAWFLAPCEGVTRNFH